MQKARHVVRDKKQYIAYMSTMDQEPLEVTHFWPIRSAIRSGGLFVPAEDLDTEFSVQSCIGGRFRSHGGWLFILQDEGKTMPAWSEEVNILPPKTKLKTEYRDGSWYKILPSGKRVKAEGIRDEKNRRAISSDVG